MRMSVSEGKQQKKVNLCDWGADNGAKGKRCRAQSTRARVLRKDVSKEKITKKIKKTYAEGRQ